MVSLFMPFYFQNQQDFDEINSTRAAYESIPPDYLNNQYFPLF